MKYFNEEQIAEIQRYADLVRDIETTVKHQYKRNTSRKTLDIAADLYEEIIGNTIKRDWGCPSCQMSFIEVFGKLYYASIQVLEAEKAAKNEEKPAENVEKPAENTKKNSKKTK